MSEQNKMDADRVAFETWHKSEMWAGDYNPHSRDAAAYEITDNGYYRDLDTQRAWRGWQARSSLLVGVPDGYALVPMEPTRDMWAAYRNADDGGILFHKSYRAMLAAAPAAPTVKAEQVQIAMPKRKPRDWQCSGGIYPADGWNAALDEVARLNPAPSLPAAGSAVEEVEIVEFDWPEYHYQGMGCGLEDRGITDRYEAMKYGWDCAIDRCAEITPDEPLMAVAQHERIVAALSAQQSAPERVSVPEGQALVPLKFVQGFNTLAHNYSLRAVPPDFYDGMGGDAFRDAYARCGRDLAELRALLAPAEQGGGV